MPYHSLVLLNIIHEQVNSSIFPQVLLIFFPTKERTYRVRGGGGGGTGGMGVGGRYGTAGHDYRRDDDGSVQIDQVHARLKPLDLI